MLESGPFRLEEIKRELYNSRDVWAITLSTSRNIEHLPELVRLVSQPVEYKRFLIDAESGDLLAMRLRETLVR